jgi:uncharacterized protein
VDPARRRDGADLLLDVRLTPRADRDRIDGPKTLSDGRTVLAARVRAVPEDGRANRALIALLAHALGLPASRLSLAAGAADRVKRVRIRNADGALEASIDSLLADPACDPSPSTPRRPAGGPRRGA